MNEGKKLKFLLLFLFYIYFLRINLTFQFWNETSTNFLHFTTTRRRLFARRTQNSDTNSTRMKKCFLSNMPRWSHSSTEIGLFLKYKLAIGIKKAKSQGVGKIMKIRYFKLKVKKSICLKTTTNYKLSCRILFALLQKIHTQYERLKAYHFFPLRYYTLSQELKDAGRKRAENFFATLKLVEIFIFSHSCDFTYFPLW